MGVEVWRPAPDRHGVVDLLTLATCDLDLHAFTAQTLLNRVRGVRRNYPYSTTPLQQD